MVGVLTSPNDAGGTPTGAAFTLTSHILGYGRITVTARQQSRPVIPRKELTR